MKLLEGQDFTIENGLMVFTREYLLNRGYCCRSGCRNCPYGFKKESIDRNSPRVVSLVPSWTETLIEANVNVVGCTRYCVHPKEKVKNLSKVGGTKKIEIRAIEQLNPDFILLDREENTIQMAELASDRAIVTDITSVKDVGPALGMMAKTFGSSKLLSFATAWERIAKAPAKKILIDQLPGVIEWVKKSEGEIKTVLYIIWKTPYMAVSRETFIGSVLEKFGVGDKIPQFESKYPEITLSDYRIEDTLLLFSSEPFPFERDKGKIMELGYPAAIVDGEKFSWFGVRSMRFLEGALGTG